MALHEARGEAPAGDCESVRHDDEVVKIPQVKVAQRK